MKKYLKKILQPTVFLSWIAIIIGILVLVGWTFKVNLLIKISPAFIGMNPVSAVNFILLGLSLILTTTRYRKYCLAACIVVLVVSVIKVCEFLFGIPLAIDGILFHNSLMTPNGLINRLAPNAVNNFIFMSISIILLNYPNKKYFLIISQVLATLSFFIGLFAIIGYLYDVKKLYAIPLFTPMALHTAICFVCISLGSLLVYPKQWLCSILSDKGPAGKMAKALLPASIFLPIIVGWLRLMGQQKGLYGVEMGAAIIVIANVVFFSVLIWYTAYTLFLTDQKRILAENTLLYISNHDHLTGLFNRKYFMEKLNQNISTDNRFAVFFIDLDGFKHINDTLGHDAGDILLKEVAQLLSQCVTHKDIVARLGGDEFTIIAKIDQTTGTKLAETILETLPKNFVYQNRTLPFGMTIGVAFFDPVCDDATTLLKNADSALYYGKIYNKGTYTVFNNQLI